MLKLKDIYDYRKELCAALRSGKYKQEHCSPSHDQHKPGHYCVLALAAKLSDDDEYELFSYKVLRKYGFDADWDGIPIFEELYRRNDGGYQRRPESFTQLANFIESLE